MRQLKASLCVAPVAVQKDSAYEAAERVLHEAGFPGNDARLHSEFQIGNNGPQDLDSELGRAGLILAACKTHADALSEHGWIEADTTLLEESITTLGG